MLPTALNGRSLPALLVMLVALLAIVAIRLIRDPLIGAIRGLEAVARGVDVAATWLLMPGPRRPANTYPREEGTRGYV